MVKTIKKRKGKKGKSNKIKLGKKNVQFKRLSER